jgi:hypothetical protein
MKIRSGVPLVALGLIGCGSISEEFGRRPDDSPPSVGIDPGSVPGSTDTRPARAAATQPPPITGGTLLITRDGATVVAADPDRDRVSIVQLGFGSTTRGPTVALNPGDEPGRLVDDNNHRVHVARPPGGAVGTIHQATGAGFSRRPGWGGPPRLA